ncbi:MAG TPA: phosphate ABC transporter substrate-binding protein [Solirubrobacteraceae bacterium]|nr:phosphate ABC transporter substrate-binding protein [Solirubrobacteraceae bacterium]
MRRPTRTLIVPLIAVVALAIPATAGAGSSALLIDGSTSIYPLMTQLAAAYHKATKQPAPKVGQGTSDAGVSDVEAGRVDIADVSRNPEESDPKGLRFTKIARDGVCMITNSKNPIANLNDETVKAIFTGNVREWSEVPGSKITGPIDLIDRIASSGTQSAFQDIFLGEQLKISPSAEAEESNGLVQNKVHVDEHAIGFVSLAFTAGVHTVGYQGIPCTLQNAKSGQYQGVRNFWMVTKGAPKGAALKFIEWIVSPSNATARKIISSQWIAIH